MVHHVLKNKSKSYIYCHLFIPTRWRKNKCIRFEMNIEQELMRLIVNQLTNFIFIVMIRNFRSFLWYSNTIHSIIIQFQFIENSTWFFLHSSENQTFRKIVFSMITKNSLYCPIIIRIRITQCIKWYWWLMLMLMNFNVWFA